MAFEHDSNDPGCHIGIIGAVVDFMIFEEIMPDVTRLNIREHVNIVAYSGRRKYRECDLYRQYRATVPANIFMFGSSDLWKTIPYTLKLLIASGNDTIRW